MKEKIMREGVPGVEASTSRTAATNQSQSRRHPCSVAWDAWKANNASLFRDGAHGIYLENRISAHLGPLGKPWTEYCQMRVGHVGPHRGAKGEPWTTDDCTCGLIPVPSSTSET